MLSRILRLLHLKEFFFALRFGALRGAIPWGARFIADFGGVVGVGFFFGIGPGKLVDRFSVVALHKFLDH